MMRILFVGNSYTLYHDVPGRVGSLLASLGRPAEVSTRAEGGATLAHHWGEAACRAQLEAGEYDALVLQDQSTRPLHHRADFLGDVTRFVCATPPATRVILFQTWARRLGHPVYDAAWSGGEPEAMTHRVNDAYEEARQRVEAAGRSAWVAPVGDAWWRMLRTDPSLLLHDTDGHHATPVGSQLAATVIAATLAPQLVATSATAPFAAALGRASS